MELFSSTGVNTCIASSGAISNVFMFMITFGWTFNSVVVIFLLSETKIKEEQDVQASEREKLLNTIISLFDSMNQKTKI